MNFFIDGAMGIGNSGVEHAEFYRAARFDQAKIPYRFVFVELVKELHEAMDKWHLRDDQVINMWEYFVHDDDYLRHGLKKRYPTSEDLVVDGTNTHRIRHSVTSAGMRMVYHYVKYPDKHDPNNKLLVVSTGRIELFNVESNERRVMIEYVDDPNRKALMTNIHLYHQNGKHYLFNNLVDLHRFFFQQLDRVFGGHSTFLIDRGEENEVALATHKIPDVKLVDVIHADHLSDRDVPAHPLWNNYNEFMLQHIDLYDRVVVATKLQRKDLLIDFPQATKKIVTIPVGGVRDGGKRRNKRKLGDPIKIITASRLASEKHIDLAIRAVAKLHDLGSNIIFDIYGQGGEDKKLKQTIQDVHAEKYVQLQGLSNDLEHVYPQYDAFISASFSEGFGLTYIEALNAALPVVTFKARFGAMELVKDGNNGFLQEFKRDDDDFNVAQLVKGLERLMQADYGRLVKNTQASVKQFQDHVIANKWKELIHGLRAID
ncbi:glycosyltransferase [Lacticaseibacillus thailandensis]|uniref:Glycosyltransferase n=1 Tax=Lacticaseibacillus thailandensis DSM 22698 = JCM 13996 TaxID=1423810 RepID=A0A0R2C6M3_9LACO|nr:glycosyltransferase [Lacticaseibacillus thailandensis]KRM87288.1 glycosyltransferase [Lacticaseibacillus thailandensis DSM 22698 = JCM 13996]